MKKIKKMPLAAKIVLGVITALLLTVGIYIIYVFSSYYRIEDNLTLEITPPKTEGSAATDTNSIDSIDGRSSMPSPGETYSIITYNVGFGAYTPDFSFFMDGGESSVAKSKESVIETISGATALVDGYDPDFILFEEVDLDSTRSYHVDQYAMISDTFDSYYTDFAINYDSPFLFYPLTEPHGKSKAGIAVYAKYEIESALRRSLPISTSFSKFFDLDRCYSISRIPTSNGKYLCIYAVHLSAYGNSDEIREGQISMLCGDMAKDYEAGNYVICGGDFNHDLKDETGENPGQFSWAYPFPRQSLPEGFSFCLDSFDDAEKETMHDSARNADMEYEEGVTFTITLDGFIVSDNVEMTEYEQIDEGYAFSDHDPVYMEFVLK